MSGSVTNKMIVVLLSGSMITGCATTPANPEKLSAGNSSERTEQIRQRDLSLLHWQGVADTASKSGDLDTGKSAYRNMLAIDSDNLLARYGLERLANERRHRGIIAVAAQQLQQGDTTDAENNLRPVLIENPKQREAIAIQRQIEEQKVKNSFHPTLNAKVKKPITLEFRDANLRSIFEMISRISSINFIFDKEVRLDLKATIFIKDGTIEETVKMLLITNQLEQKVLSENTVLIYPNTPARIRDYQELVVKSFYLGNADVKQTLNMLKTILKSNDIYLDERLNMLVIRDTPEAVAMAEKLIAAQDLAEPEVMLEMEVLEVSSSRLSELGIRYPSQIGFGVVGGIGGAQTSGLLSLNQLHNITDDMVNVTLPDPAILLKLSNTDTGSNLLANPRIRVKNREKAKIHIGERVPVITTTSTANVGISESVSYLEVGLKLNVEPDIHLDDDVAIKVALEVSNIIDIITTTSGSKTYRLGTRTAETTLRIKDGETQVLAGLIQDIDRKSAQKIPLLGDIPLLGHLFSSNEKNKNKTEIMLLITPHIVRNLERPAAHIAEFMSGTASSVGTTLLTMAPNTKAAVTSAPSSTTYSYSSDSAPSVAPAIPDTNDSGSSLPTNEDSELEQTPEFIPDVTDTSPSSEEHNPDEGLSNLNSQPNSNSTNETKVPQFSAVPYKAPTLPSIPTNDQ